ncbi:MAG: hypothetical protein Q7K54_01620 [Candidatus Parcubacteria bacterium]|nr:hypothetical protein [Candidatus Parcubacteria bacterium]
MEILGKILGNSARVKIMRLFLLNKSKTFRSKDIVNRSRVNADTVRRELNLLNSVGFVRKSNSVPSDFSFNYAFKYASAFEELLIRSDSLNKKAILDNFKKVGKMKLMIVAGVFIKNDDSRVDLLIVGDNMKKSKIEEGVRRIEAEVGTELTYAVFDTEDFLYRLKMYDKLIRDILDYPHEVLLQVKELSTPLLKKD